MNNPTLGIIGGGQLGSLLGMAAKKINIKTIVLSDDIDAPAKNFSNEFIYGKYDDLKNEIEKIIDFISLKVDDHQINLAKSIVKKESLIRTDKSIIYNIRNVYTEAKINLYKSLFTFNHCI